MAAIVANCAISLNCELTRPVSVEYINVNVFSQDNAGNTVHVYVHYDGEPQEIVGSVSANVIRADGTTVAVPGAIQGNRAYVIFPQAVYAVPGVVSVVVKVTEGTTVTTIAAFVANVYRSTTDVVVDPGQIIPSIQNLIAAIETAMNSFPADLTDLLAAVAPNYSSSSTYPIVGSIVWYDGVLKRNIVAIDAAETFNPEHWENVAIAKVVNSNSNQLSQIRSEVEQFAGAKPITFEIGFYYTTVDVGSTSVKTPTNAYACALVPVTIGERITMNVTGINGNNRAYAYLDSEMKVVDRSATNLSGERTVLIPEGAAYIAINNRLISQNSGFYAYKGVPVSKKFDTVTEKVSGGYITPIDRTSSGVTGKTVDNVFTLYGTNTTGRYWCIFNGNDSIRTASSSFLKSFDPGTYEFEIIGAGTKPGFSFYYTYTSFSSRQEVLLGTHGTKNVVTFTDPAMVALLLAANAEYGTEEAPTTYTINIRKLSAIDYTAREVNATNAAIAAALADVATKAPAIIENASGTIAHFTDGADMPLQRVTASVAYKQAGTGDPSPENIRQISGATSYKVSLSNENLFGGDLLKEGIKASIPSATITESENKISFAVGAEVSAEYPFITDFCGLTGKFKERTKYTIWFQIQKSAGSTANIDIVYTDGTSESLSVAGTSKTVIFSETNELKTLKGLRKNGVSGTTTIWYNSGSGIVEGDAFVGMPNGYGKTYEIEFPDDAGEVFGGTLQVNADGSGTLTVDRGMYVFDSADKIVAVGEASTGVLYMQGASIGANCVDGDTSLISNQYKTVVTSAPAEGTAIRVNTSGGNGAIYIYDNRFTDAETAAAICEANPIQVCYALATPIVFNFTAGQIKSVLGKNHVWAETGDVTLKYAADTKLYIDAAIAAAVGS